MEIKIIKEKENPFFKRKDLILDVTHLSEPTPKTDDVAKELASMFSVDQSQVVVDYILTKRGLSESSVKAKIMYEKPVKIEEKKEEPEPSEKPESVESTPDHEQNASETEGE